MRWSIRCASEAKGDGYLHKLYLSRFLGADERFIYASGRNCDVLWADDGQRFAITDWSGSSAAEVYVVDISHPEQVLPLDVREAARFASKTELEGHCYYEAVKWENARHLLICVSGHTDENPSHGFGYYLLLDTSSGDAKLVRKIDEEPSHPTGPASAAPRRLTLTLAKNRASMSGTEAVNR
jgi:hypothetical protein